MLASACNCGHSSIKSKKEGQTEAEKHKIEKEMDSTITSLPLLKYCERWGLETISMPMTFLFLVKNVPFLLLNHLKQYLKLHDSFNITKNQSSSTAVNHAFTRR